MHAPTSQEEVTRLAAFFIESDQPRHKKRRHSKKWLEKRSQMGQDMVRYNLSPEGAAGEAKEAHEFLDSQGVPWKVYSPDGKLSDDLGTYYLMPLVDRIQNFGDAKHAAAMLSQDVL